MEAIRTIYIRYSILSVFLFFSSESLPSAPIYRVLMFWKYILAITFSFAIITFSRYPSHRSYISSSLPGLLPKLSLSSSALPYFPLVAAASSPHMVLPQDSSSFELRTNAIFVILLLFCKCYCSQSSAFLPFLSPKFGRKTEVNSSSYFISTQL